MCCLWLHRARRYLLPSRDLEGMGLALSTAIDGSDPLPNPELAMVQAGGTTVLH